MKTLATFTKTASAVFVASCLCLIIAQAKAGTNEVFFNIQNAKSVQDVIFVAPDIEELWPKQPEAYFKSVNLAVGVLAGSKNKVIARSALLSMWTNMLPKKLPTNDVQILPCVDAKWETICVYLTQVEFSEDKSRLIDAAKYIGEIRSLIISDYVNQGAKLSISMPDNPETVRKLVKENERKKIADKVQRELRIKNLMYSNDLLGNIPFPKQKDERFIDAFAKAAQLTSDEIKLLNERYD